MGLFKNKSVEEIIVNDLSKRYQDEFEVLSSEYAGFYSKSSKFILRSKRFPKARIFVTLYSTGEIVDNYLTYYHDNEHYQAITKVIGEFIDKFKLVTMPAMYEMRQDLNWGLADYFNSLSSDLHCNIILPANTKFDFNSFVKKVIPRLKELHLLENEITVYQLRDGVSDSNMDVNFFHNTPGPMENFMMREWYLSLTESYEIDLKEEEYES